MDRIESRGLITVLSILILFFTRFSFEVYTFSFILEAQRYYVKYRDTEFRTFRCFVSNETRVDRVKKAKTNFFPPLYQ